MALALTFQGVELTFSALAGVLVVLAGAIALIMIDIFTFAVAAVLFAGIRTLAVVEEEEKVLSPGSSAIRAWTSRYLAELREGVSLVKGSVILKIVVASSVANFTFGAFRSVLPAFADALGGAGAYGALLAALAGGSLIGALLAPALERYPYSTLMITATLIECIVIVSTSLVAWLPATVLLFALAWVPLGATNVMFFAVLQRIVPSRLLGRVSTVLFSVTAAIAPLGYLVGGAIGDVLGSTSVVVATGVSLLIVTAYWTFDPQLRRFPPVKKLDPSQYGLGRVWT